MSPKAVMRTWKIIAAFSGAMMLLTLGFAGFSVLTGLVFTALLVLALISWLAAGWLQIKAERHDAKRALSYSHQLAAAQERYFTEHSRFAESLQQLNYHSQPLMRTFFKSSDYRYHVEILVTSDERGWGDQISVVKLNKKDLPSSA